MTICPKCSMGVMLPFAGVEECNICNFIEENPMKVEVTEEALEMDSPVYVRGLGWMDEGHMDRLEVEMKKRERHEHE